MGEVQDIAQTTVFLFSQGASYITGQTIVVDGGHYLQTSSPAYPQSVLASVPDSKL